MSMIKAKVAEAINRHVRNSIKVLLEQVIPELSVNVTSVNSTLENGDSPSNIHFSIIITGHTVPKDVIPPTP
jgi:hypothetical protein